MCANMVRFFEKSKQITVVKQLVSRDVGALIILKSPLRRIPYRFFTEKPKLPSRLPRVK